jgi:hypothetical protein
LLRRLDEDIAMKRALRIAVFVPVCLLVMPLMLVLAVTTSLVEGLLTGAELLVDVTRLRDDQRWC